MLTMIIVMRMLMLMMIVILIILMMMMLLMMIKMMMMLLMMMMMIMRVDQYHQCRPTASQSVPISEDRAGTGEKTFVQIFLYIVWKHPL